MAALPSQARPETRAAARTKGHAAKRFVPWSSAAWLRLVWAVGSVYVVESAVLGVAALPAVLFYRWHLGWTPPGEWLRVVVLVMAAVPTYLLFAFVLMLLSALSTRVLGWRTPRDAELRIADLEWPLLDWARYMVSIHIVRVFAGTVLRTTPVWTLYMRMNGARLGRRVFINSLDVTDHSLLDFGDDVVIGAGVHLSGHTVERGLVKTGGVTLGAGVTVGVGANVEIGVCAGPGCTIGALSAVPKHEQLEANATYVGAPARKLER
jgi:acetyltransferase-like isoleucine patch superfamily enzyme